MLWKYRTILFEFTKDGLLGDRYVDDEELERSLNELGALGWELVNVTLLQDGLLAILKHAAAADTVTAGPTVRPVAAAAPGPERAARPPEPVESDVAGPRARRTTLLAEPIELWAWVGAYDHVVLCQLWGPMADLPPAMPRFTRELRQFWEDCGSPRMPPRPRDAHDALVDARHNLDRYRLIAEMMTAPR